jgi:DNA adenine methylase
MKSAIRWYGGKGRMYRNIINLLPNSSTYVEVFGGGASVLLNKTPSSLEVYNDINGDLCNFFRVLSDPEQFEKFYRRVQPLPYAKEIYNECKNSFETEEDVVLRAVKFFVASRQSFSGVIKSGWSYDIRTANKNGKSWVKTIDGLPEIHHRLRFVQIQNMDWKEILDVYDGINTTWYCDPPYIPDTRKSPNVYDNEMSDIDHTELVSRILDLKGNVVLSGYNHPIYNRLDEYGWVRHDFEVACTPSRVVGEKRDGRTESVWVKAGKIRSFC